MDENLAEARFAAIEAALAEVTAKADRLAVENAALRAELRGQGIGGADAAPPVPPATDPAADRTAGVAGGQGAGVSRRGLLGAAAGMAAAGAAGVVASAAPAAAANGSTLTLGTTANTATGATALVMTNPSGTTSGYGLGVIDTSYSGGFTDVRPAVFGYATGTALNVGGRFDSAGSIGVLGNNTADDGTGVSAQSSGAGGHGVYSTALGDGGTAVTAAANGAASTGVAASGAAYGAVLQTSVDGVGAYVIAQRAHLRLVPFVSPRSAPTGDTTPHERGDLVADSSGGLWYCVTAGTPGTWRQLAGHDTAGAFHALAKPVRIYDSRPGQAPHIGPQAPLAPGAKRTLSLAVNASTVPDGATAAMVNVLLVGAAAGDGNFTIFANGAGTPASNTLVWGGSAGRFSTLAVTALDAKARVQVVANLKTDLVVDVVGWYL